MDNNVAETEELLSRFPLSLYDPLDSSLLLSTLLLGCNNSRIITIFRFLRLGGERKQHGKIQVHIVPNLAL